MFLPLAHSLARVTQMVVLDVGATIAYGRGDPKALLEGYRLSETTAAATLNTASQFCFGTVGRPLPATEVSIAADGKILIRGPSVFAGYFEDDQATREALTEDGWLRSRDLGSLNQDGYLRITGREKDVVVTSGGKSIAPANIEAALREIRWATGDPQGLRDTRVRRRSAVPHRDAHARPRQCSVAGRLPTRRRTRRLGDATHERVIAELRNEVERVNARFTRVEQVKRFTILDRDPTQGTSELTPTQKAKQAVVYSNIKDVIDTLY